MIRGPQKQRFQESQMQIHKYKYLFSFERVQARFWLGFGNTNTNIYSLWNFYKLVFDLVVVLNSHTEWKMATSSVPTATVHQSHQPLELPTYLPTNLHQLTKLALSFKLLIEIEMHLDRHLDPFHLLRVEDFLGDGRGPSGDPACQTQWGALGGGMQQM